MYSEILKYKKILILLCCVLLVLGFVTYSFISPYGLFSSLKNDLKNIEPTVEFSYTDLDGNKINLSDFKGKPLIVNSWASWIPFSQTELPLLIKAQQTYSDELTILAINRMEQVAIVRSFLATFDIQLSMVFLLDSSDNFYKAIGGYAMPETVFYDAEGNLIVHKRGVLTEDELNGYIETILTKR